MFERVLAGERRRTRQRSRAALAASIVAHALLTAGAASLPLGPSGAPAPLEELVSFVDLPPVPRPDAVPAREQPRVAPRGGRDESGEATAPHPGEASPPTTARVAEVPERLPDVRVGLELPLSLATAPILRAPRFAASAVDGRDAAPAAGDVVEADVLAERPRLANRWEMERLWRQLYPRMLELRGITGEALVSFVIDEQGRVLPETVELLSATRAEFGEAALRGISRLRFRPMRVGGVPVRVRTTLPVLWRLQTA